MRFVRLWVFSVGWVFWLSRGWVCLASFSPCHYCLEIEGGGGVRWRGLWTGSAFYALRTQPPRFGHRRGLWTGSAFYALRTQPLAEITVVVLCPAVPFSPGNPADRLVHHRSYLLSRAFLTVKTRPRT